MKHRDITQNLLSAHKGPIRFLLGNTRLAWLGPDAITIRCGPTAAGFPWLPSQPRSANHENRIGFLWPVSMVSRLVRVAATICDVDQVRHGCWAYAGVRSSWGSSPPLRCGQFPAPVGSPAFGMLPFLFHQKLSDSPGARVYLGAMKITINE